MSETKGTQGWRGDRWLNRCPTETVNRCWSRRNSAVSPTAPTSTRSRKVSPTASVWDSPVWGLSSQTSIPPGPDATPVSVHWSCGEAADPSLTVLKRVRDMAPKRSDRLDEILDDQYGDLFRDHPYLETADPAGAVTQMLDRGDLRAIFDLD